MQPSKGKGTFNVSRIEDNRPSDTSPSVLVKITHNKGTSALALLPDTGADSTIMGPDHLISIGLTLEDLHTITQTPIYGADGSPMLPAIGSVQVQLEVKGKSIQ